MTLTACHPVRALHPAFQDAGPPCYCSPLPCVLGDPRDKETCPAHTVVGAVGPVRTRPLHHLGVNPGRGCPKKDQCVGVGCPTHTCPWLQLWMEFGSALA